MTGNGSPRRVARAARRRDSRRCRRERCGRRTLLPPCRRVLPIDQPAPANRAACGRAYAQASDAIAEAGWATATAAASPASATPALGAAGGIAAAATAGGAGDTSRRTP